MSLGSAAGTTESWSDGADGVAGVVGESKFNSREEDIELIVVGGDAMKMASDPGAGGGGMEGRGVGGFTGEIVVCRDRGAVLDGEGLRVIRARRSRGGALAYSSPAGLRHSRP